MQYSNTPLRSALAARAPWLCLRGAGSTTHSPFLTRAGRWELGKVEGKRGQGQRRKLVVKVEEVEHEIDPKEATQFEPSHAQDLPNMVMMGNLHEVRLALSSTSHAPAAHHSLSTTPPPDAPALTPLFPDS